MKNKVLHAIVITAIIIACYTTHQYFNMKFNKFQLEDTITKQEAEIMILGNAYSWYQIEYNIATPFDTQIDSLKKELAFD
jgi:hypothetical protein